MKTIALTRGKFAQVNDDLFEELNQHRWFAQPANRGVKTFYAVRNQPLGDGRKTTRQMHREIFRLRNKPVPKRVDHRDRDGLNNQWKNLRPATGSESNSNRDRRADNKSGFIGVVWNKQAQKYKAYGSVNGKQKHLGYFDDPAQAARVRDKFVKKHHGEFAVLNER